MIPKFQSDAAVLRVWREGGVPCTWSIPSGGYLSEEYETEHGFCPLVDLNPDGLWQRMYSE